MASCTDVASQSLHSVDCDLGLDQLPSEILLSILEKCDDHATIVNFMAVSQKFKNLVQSNWSRLPKHRMQHIHIQRRLDSRLLCVTLRNNSNHCKLFVFLLRPEEELVDCGSSKLLELSRGRFHDQGSYIDQSNIEIIRILDWAQADELIEQLLRRVEFDTIWLAELSLEQMTALQKTFDWGKIHTRTLRFALAASSTSDCLLVAAYCANVTRCANFELYLKDDFSSSDVERKLLQPLHQVFESVLIMWLEDVPPHPLPSLNCIPNCRELAVCLEYDDHWRTIVSLVERVMFGRLESCAVDVITDVDAETVYEYFIDCLKAKRVAVDVVEYRKNDFGLEFTIVPNDSTLPRISVKMEEIVEEESLEWIITRM